MAAGGDQRYLHVLAVDGAVTASTATGDSTVTLTLADGRTAVIAFNHDAVGATLTLAGVATTLGSGVNALAE